MDYEKKYNEALERASHIKDNNTVATPQEVAEHIFPELRESDDERIRKYLVEELKTAKSVGELKFIIPQSTREECITYLEKQKEPHIPWYDYKKSKEAGYTIVPNEEYDRLTKPAEWSEEDERKIRQLVVLLKSSKGKCMAAFYKDIDECIAWVYNLRPSWKPSEEQMKALEVAFRKDGDDEYRNIINSLYNDLKKL